MNAEPSIIHFDYSYFLLQSKNVLQIFKEH
jgi:hypothetical protein